MKFLSDNIDILVIILAPESGQDCQQQIERAEAN